MDEDVLDDWQWHREGRFPKGADPVHAYVHIAVFTAWLARRKLIDRAALPDDAARTALDELEGEAGSMTALLTPTDGRLRMSFMTPEGRGFASAYYAPEYGYPRDWQRTFGKQADVYAVPEDWETYREFEPILDQRYGEWVAAGRPELTQLPGLMGRLARLLDRRR
jgi:hypothetical protein